MTPYASHNTNLTSNSNQSMRVNINFTQTVLKSIQ